MAYSLNVLDVLGGRMFISPEPSMIIASAFGSTSGVVTLRSPGLPYKASCHHSMLQGTADSDAVLSNGGNLYRCQKSQLTAVLETKFMTPDVEPNADAIIIDGSGLVNILPPRTSRKLICH